MASLLLAVIYLAFIGLGLPDSLLGSAWPVMRIQLHAPISFAGVVSMLISGGTIVSSLLSDRLTRRFGAALVTAVSVLLTAVALFGFSISNAAWMLCLWAIPYGLGAGAVDAALNNYVALHYTSRHMSWLHCFWGVGTAISPLLMSVALQNGMGWTGGYRMVSFLQLGLTLVLFLSIPLWKKRVWQKSGEASDKPKTLAQILRIRGVPFVLATFFGYCALETTAGLWASSYLVMARGVQAETAAQFASLFYLGITLGRLLSGFVADRLGDRKLIRIGLAVILLGVAGLLTPVNEVALVSLLLIGLGCAPVYPSIIHATPFHFGKENSQAVIGVQMASAYAGSTLAPPLFGVLAQYVGSALYPFYLLLLAALIIVMSEKLNRLVKA